MDRALGYWIDPSGPGAAPNPFIIKMAGRGGEMALNLVFLGATLLIVLVVAWPYIGGWIWPTLSAGGGWPWKEA